MKNAHDVVLLPLITEKSTVLRETRQVYCFKVHPQANKIEIAWAIEKLFERDGIRVADVRTMHVRGKQKRMGRFVGRRPSWKKAWVRLAPGSKEISLFENA